MYYSTKQYLKRNLNDSNLDQILLFNRTTMQLLLSKFSMNKGWIYCKCTQIKGANKSRRNLIKQKFDLFLTLKNNFQLKLILNQKRLFLRTDLKWSKNMAQSKILFLLKINQYWVLLEQTQFLIHIFWPISIPLKLTSEECQI